MTVYLFMAAMLLKNPITLVPELQPVIHQFTKQKDCNRAGSLAQYYGYIEPDWICKKVVLIR